MCCCAVGNICPVRHNSVIANRRIAADAGIFPDFGTCTDNAVRINERVVLHGYIAVDFCACIQQNSVAHNGTILDAGILQDYTASPDFCKGTDIGTGCNDIRESIK